MQLPFLITAARLPAACFCLCLLCHTLPSAAQAKSKPDGYYVYQRYKLWVAQVTDSGSDINLKLLWLNNVVHLRPLNDSSFFDVDRPGGDSMIVTFRKDEAGNSNQFVLKGYGLWQRDNNYVPHVYKEIAHTPEALKPFEGYYQDTQGQFLHLREKDNQLLMKRLWNGGEISFVPDSSMHFFCKGNTAFTLGFVRKPDGAFRLTYDQEGWEKLKEPMITAAAWKAFEGTFRSKDDPDNLIRIAATGTGLLVKQLWNGLQTEVKPLSGRFFCSVDQSFTLLFNKDLTSAVLLYKNEFERVEKDNK